MYHPINISTNVRLSGKNCKMPAFISCNNSSIQIHLRTLTFKKTINTYLVDFPVTVSVNVRRIFGGRMSSFKTFDSVANGNPLSSISSNSYQKSYFLVNIIKRQHGVPLLHLMAGVIKQYLTRFKNFS